MLRAYSNRRDGSNMQLHRLNSGWLSLRNGTKWQKGQNKVEVSYQYVLFFNKEKAMYSIWFSLAPSLAFWIFSYSDVAAAVWGENISNIVINTCMVLECTMICVLYIVVVGDLTTVSIIKLFSYTLFVKLKTFRNLSYAFKLFSIIKKE